MTVAQLWLPGGETAKAETAVADARFAQLLEAGALASAPVPVDPMEIAFHEAARANGHVHDGRTLVHTSGLRPDLLAMSNVWQSSGADDTLLVAAKGAPEAIAGLCSLAGDNLEALETAARTMAQQGMRVLGIACAKAPREAQTAAHETLEFTLLGLVGLADPLRPGVVEAVTQCRSAGIRVVMITGDYAATARAIASEAGLADDALMTGAEVAALDDGQLAMRIGSVSVFARTMPEQKLRIVTALKAAGEVVAMTGDGVNDAPALKAAHIGIAMGKRGTDVAREAAAIVLVDDDFGAIVAAIRTGRRIYDNIRKAMGFIFGAHVPIAVLALGPLLLDGPLVLGPIQIALLEMIIDPACALVFEAERDETGLMERPPRSPSARLFSLTLIARGLVQGGLAAAALLALYLVAEQWDLPDIELRTLVFYALAAAVFALILANRSFSISLSHALLRGNVTFRYVFLFLSAGGGLILLVPPLQRVLGFARLDLFQLGLVGLTGAGLLVIFELTKIGRRTAPPR